MGQVKFSLDKYIMTIYLSLVKIFFYFHTPGIADEKRQICQNLKSPSSIIDRNQFQIINIVNIVLPISFNIDLGCSKDHSNALAFATLLLIG